MNKKTETPTMFEREQRNDDEALRWVLGNATGRRVISCILDRLGFMKSGIQNGEVLNTVCMAMYNNLCDLNSEGALQVVTEMLTRRNAIRREAMANEEQKRKEYDENLV